jgi:activator of HSP90 ATPase
MRNSFRISAVIPAARRRVYDAWLDSKEHGAFTSAKARVQAKVGGRFTAHDGYISGKTLELKPSRLIVQSWRTTEFPAEAPDSHLELRFEDAPNGTRLTLLHSGLPPDQADSYKSGWREYYFAPMRAYFAESKPARRKG